jgi:hypothetical protein
MELKQNIHLLLPISSKLSVFPLPKCRWRFRYHFFGEVHHNQPEPVPAASLLLLQRHVSTPSSHPATRHGRTERQQIMSARFGAGLDSLLWC